MHKNETTRLPQKQTRNSQHQHSLVEHPRNELHFLGQT